MMKRFVGAGGVVLVAFAAACTSEVPADAESTESVGRTSQALIETACVGDVAIKPTASGACNTYSPITITAADLKLNEVRAQAYFSYIMGGPAVPASITIGPSPGGTTYNVRGQYWSTGPFGQLSTSARLDALRARVAAGVSVVNAGSDTLCGKTIAKYFIPDYAAAQAANGVNTNMNYELNWCFGLDAGGNAVPTPTFFQVAYDQSTVTLDPEPVTLNAGQTLPAVGTYSSSTNAAATGSNTGAAYAQAATNDQGGGIFRWPSAETYAASTTQLAIQSGAKALGVPCVTPDQSGTSTSKFIKKGMLANKYLCVTP